MLDIFGTLIERPVIKKDFDPHYWRVIEMMEAELNNAKLLFDDVTSLLAETGTMPVHKNLPPVAGALKWTQEIRDRISVLMTDFRRLEHPYVCFDLNVKCRVVLFAFSAQLSSISNNLLSSPRQPKVGLFHQKRSST